MLVSVKHPNLISLLPRNYQVIIGVVHELKIGDIAFMQIQTICNKVAGILVLIDSLKEAKTMDMILAKC